MLINIKKIILGTLLCCLVPVLGFLGARPAFSTPSSTYWTPCTIDIQPAGVNHLGIDNYSNIGTSHPLGQFPTDIGLEWGARLTPKLAVEYGFDILTSPSITPYYFNAKIGFRENVLAKNAPALQLGFFNWGTQRSGVDSRQNIIYLVTGKTLANNKTRLMAAYYSGNADVLISGASQAESNGYMVAFDHQIVPGKWVLAGDYASGKNAIGGGGIGVYYYCTPNISLLSGPVWFNDTSINGDTKLTVQLDINF